MGSRCEGIVLSRPLEFRHITFADDLRPRGQALNLTPRVRVPYVALNSYEESQLNGQDEVLVNWVLRQGGVQPSDYKPGTLARRLPACLRALRCSDAVVARRQIERNPALLPIVMNALVIGVTSFFRDTAVFNALKHDVLPDLLNRSGTLRIWSVGCSEGPEVYSLAMLLAEQNALFRAKLLGTDCREAGIRRAIAGVYTDEEIASVPTELRDRYFVPEGPSWKATNTLRQAMHFRTGDATRSVEPGAFDLICCRNLAIYLQPAAAGKLWLNLESALRPGGVLVLGKAEAPIGARRLSQVGSCMFRRTRG